MSVHRRASVWIGILPLIGGASLAHAQPSPPTTAAPVHSAAPSPSAAAGSVDGAAEAEAAAIARAAHLRGLAAREDDDWHRARAAFAEAWAHKRHWEIAINLGEAEMRTSRYEEAIGHLGYVLQEAGFLDRSPDLVEKEKATVLEWLAEARIKLEAQRAARTVPPKAAPPPPAPLSRTWQLGVGVGAGLTVAGIVTSAVLLASASSKIDGVKSSLEALPGRPGDPGSVRCQGAGEAVCASNVERLRSADAMQAAGGGILLTSGLIAAATVVISALGTKRSALMAAPAAGNGTVGLAVVGAW
jgi:hypothetical protein